MTQHSLASSGQRDQLGNRQAAKKRHMRTAFTFWMFVGPMFLGLIVFTYLPILWGFVLSFFDARLTLTPKDFIGLQNYIDMLSDTNFTRSLFNFALFALFIVPTTFGIALGLALLVNSVGFGQSLFRSVFFLPTACSYVVASLIWKLNLFNSLPFGFANVVLGWFQIDPIVWIGTVSPPWHWVVLVTVRLWLQAGFYMILFLAGLQEIPRSLYEAAAIDGASRGWTTFRHITFPLLRHTSVSVLLLTLIAAFQSFDEFYNILFGGASNNTALARPPLVYLYQVALGDQNYGRGAAGSFILTAIILLVTLVQARWLGFGKSEQ